VRWGSFKSASVTLTDAALPCLLCSNGFPRWRGSGYYYARFRPGLGLVGAFLVLVTSSIQLLVKHLNYTRDRKRLENLTTSAKLLAWGPRFRSIEAGLENDNLAAYNKNIIVPAEKKVRVPLSGFDLTPPAPKTEGMDEKEYWDNDEKLVRKLMAKSASNGSEPEGPRRFIDALVTKEAVFIISPGSKEWIPLDENAAPKPTAKDTWPFTLALAVAAKVGYGQQGTPTAISTEDEIDPAPVVNGGKKKKNKKRQ
jgi:DnaJ family protein C protein 1